MISKAKTGKKRRAAGPIFPIMDKHPCWGVIDTPVGPLAAALDGARRLTHLGLSQRERAWIAANEHDQLGDTSTLADPGVVKDLVDNRMNRA